MINTENKENIVIATAEVDGIIMDYAKIGNGKKNFIILPGLSLKKVTPSARAVARRYNIFIENGYTLWVFDRRDNLPGNYSVEQIADDTVTVMKYLGLKNSSVFGSSQGGSTALCIAINYPGMINSLVVCSTPAKTEKSLSDFTENLIKLATDRNVTGLVDAFGSCVYSETMWKKFRNAVIMMNQNIEIQELEKFIILSEAMNDFDLYANLNKINCSVFVVGSKGDRVVSSQSCIELAEKLECKIYMYDSSFGHAVYDEADDFPEKCYKFIKESEILNG